MSDLICKINHTVTKGESVSQVIFEKCGVTQRKAGKLSSEWARATDPNARLYDLERWVKFTRERSPALSRLPIAKVKEVILTEIATKLKVDVNRLPKNLQFVLVDPGERIEANVVRQANGKLELQLHSDQVSTVADSSRVYGCFAGTTMLRLEDRRIVTLEQLAVTNEGESLPKIACWDKEGAKVIYQQPLAINEHHYEIAERVVELYLKNSNGGSLQALKVTPNHTFLTQQAQGFIDRPAGCLQGGEILLNPYDQENWACLPQRTEAAQERDVYSVSLVKKDNPTLQSPYYLVSPDGIHWTVAHNADIKF